MGFFREAMSCREHVCALLRGLCIIQAPGAGWRRAFSQGLEELQELLGLASTLRSRSSELMASGPRLLRGESLSGLCGEQGASPELAGCDFILCVHRAIPSLLCERDTGL